MAQDYCIEMGQNCVGVTKEAENEFRVRRELIFAQAENTELWVKVRFEYQEFRVIMTKLISDWHRNYSSKIPFVKNKKK